MRNKSHLILPLRSAYEVHLLKNLLIILDMRTWTNIFVQNETGFLCTIFHFLAHWTFEDFIFSQLIYSQRSRVGIERRRLWWAKGMQFPFWFASFAFSASHLSHLKVIRAQPKFLIDDCKLAEECCISCN
jgi:hypothetical protein